MQLTSGRTWDDAGRRRLPRALALMAIAGSAGLVFALDWATGLPHVQHLYYFPIILAATRFGLRGGGAAAALAIALYHLANPHALSWRYEEFDIVQIAVFAAIGLVAARLADDARRLHQLAMTDDLTGLHNLRSFELHLERLMQKARTGRTSISMLVLDVDRLKSLNDRHGHLTGAEAVRAVGRAIAAQVPDDAIACRYGGDEFVVALPGAGVADARRIADALREAVQAAAPTLAGVAFPAGTLSISVGLACRAFDGSDSAAHAGAVADGEALFRAADAALYAAKNAGRNAVHVA